MLFNISSSLNFILRSASNRFTSTPYSKMIMVGTTLMSPNRKLNIHLPKDKHTKIKFRIRLIR